MCYLPAAVADPKVHPFLEEAYIEAEEKIGMEHVRTAVRQMGQSYFLGLAHVCVLAS